MGGEFGAPPGHGVGVAPARAQRAQRAPRKVRRAQRLRGRAAACGAPGGHVAGEVAGVGLQGCACASHLGTHRQRAEQPHLGSGRRACTSKAGLAGAVMSPACACVGSQAAWPSRRTHQPGVPQPSKPRSASLAAARWRSAAGCEEGDVRRLPLSPVHASWAGCWACASTSCELLAEQGWTLTLRARRAAAWPPVLSLVCGAPPTAAPASLCFATTARRDSGSRLPSATACSRLASALCPALAATSAGIEPAGESKARGSVYGGLLLHCGAAGFVRISHGMHGTRIWCGSSPAYGVPDLAPASAPSAFLAAGSAPYASSTWAVSMLPLPAA